MFLERKAEDRWTDAARATAGASPDIAASNTYRQLPEVTQRSPGNVSIMLKLKPNRLVLENLEEVNLMRGEGLCGTAVKWELFTHRTARTICGSV